MPTATDARRLVIGAAVGFSVDQVRIFVESLRATGYAGDVAMLIGWRDNELAAWLRRHDVTPKRTWFVRRFHGPIHAYRFQLFADYLRAHRDRYDEVLISDVRDVAFQAHPFAGLAGDAVHYFLEGDNRSIGDERVNMIYVQLFLPEADVERLKPCRISCCGVVMGGMAAMSAYLEGMNADLAAVPMKVRRKIGADTAFHNRMGHLTRPFPVVMIENNIHVATMGIEPASIYRVTADGEVRMADGTLPAILHQYDRLPEIKAPVEARWR